LITVPYRYRQTTCNLITALCVASRGKNYRKNKNLVLLLTGYSCL